MPTRMASHPHLYHLYTQRCAHMHRRISRTTLRVLLRLSALLKDILQSACVDLVVPYQLSSQGEPLLNFLAMVRSNFQQTNHRKWRAMSLLHILPLPQVAHL